MRNLAHNQKLSQNLLAAAAEVLKRSRKPLTAREIARGIKNDPALRSCLGGKTPHKTVQARLSTDIIKRDESSSFYRYSPATFGLRELVKNKQYSSGFRSAASWIRREKRVTNEYVAAVRRKDIPFFSADGFYESRHFPLTALDLLDVLYVPRRQIEDCSDFVQLVSYAAIMVEKDILTYERGKYTSDKGEFVGNYSIGIGGHISLEDRSLFDLSPIGLESNILREIGEELFLIRKEIWRSIVDLSFAGFLVDTTTRNGKQHLGLASVVVLNKKIELESRTLGIRNLHWTDIRLTSNSFHRFEIWSQYFLRTLEQRMI